MEKQLSGGLLKLNKLWAPWRIKYIVGHKTRGCVLCAIQKQKSDKKSLIIFRSRYCFVVLNKFPYNNGHLMIVPYRHVGAIEKISMAEFSDMNSAMVRAIQLLKVVLNPQGYNIGLNIGKCSGAGIDKHVHMHIVPRWQGDTNFMTIVNDTRVISQSLNELYLKLKQCLHAKKLKNGKKKIFPR